MKHIKKIFKPLLIILGIISVLSIITDFLAFSKLQPKMKNLEDLSQFENGVLTAVGFQLLLLLVFFILSALQLVQNLRTVKRVTVMKLLLLFCTVLSTLFVFSDIALLSDIAKQHKYGWAQPEWTLIYPIMAFQLIVVCVLTLNHAFGFNVKNQEKHIACDTNIFTIVQYVGTVCGLIGLALSILGSFYSQYKEVGIHTILLLVSILSPYVLAVVYWIIIKLQEKTGMWYDEKQSQDVGKSAFLTLILSCLLMFILLIINMYVADGALRFLIFPLYIFFVISVFSLSNLYFKGR